MNYENTDENTGVIGDMDVAALSDYSQMKGKLSKRVKRIDDISLSNRGIKHSILPIWICKAVQEENRI